MSNLNKFWLLTDLGNNISKVPPSRLLASKARLAAPTRPAAANAGLSEDEALAAALAASLQGGTGPGAEGEISRAREEEDRMLALALQESERQAQARRSQTAGGDRQNCRLQ